eukprot:2115319-Amphidinium_carterae.1
MPHLADQDSKVALRECDPSLCASAGGVLARAMKVVSHEAPSVGVMGSFPKTPDRDKRGHIGLVPVRLRALLASNQAVAQGLSLTPLPKPTSGAGIRLPPTRLVLVFMDVISNKHAPSESTVGSLRNSMASENLLM